LKIVFEDRSFAWDTAVLCRAFKETLADD